MTRDLRYSFRTLGRSPGFTAVTVLSLALGIGAATAIFSAVYGVLIDPYPYAKPNEIWAPFLRDAKSGRQLWHAYSYRDLREIQKLPAVADAMATTYDNVLLTGDRSPEFFNDVRLSVNAFNFLGVEPVAGRTIQPSDLQPNGEPEPVVVLSYLLWQRLFQGDTAAIGKRLVLNGLPHTIIGVMPPRFGWYGNDSFWLPLGDDPHGERSLMVILRLKPRAAKDAAEQQLQALHLRLAAESPDSFPKDGFRSTLRNYLDMTVASGAMRSSLYLLLAMVAFLLLIACANVASLQLARTTARAREIAIRLSIGAGRRRVFQQLLTESVLLAVAGGALGVLFAVASTKAIVALMPQFNLPNEARIELNGSVLLFSLAVSLLTGILFGLAPAIQATRSDLASALKDGARGAGLAIGGRRARDILVAVEIALAVILLVGSSFAVRTFLRLQHVDLGYRADRVLLVGLPLQPKRYPTLEQRNRFAQQLLEKLKHSPGVRAAAIGNGGFTYGGPQSTYAIEGRPRPEQSRVRVGLISDGYLGTMGIPLLRGRALSAQEVAHGDHVALLNDAAARLWPAGRTPIGSSVQLDLLQKPDGNSVLIPAGGSSDVTVVGIVGNTKNAGLRDATAPAVFVPYTLMAPPSRTVAVRTFGDPRRFYNTLRGEVLSLDKEQPITRPITLKELAGFETLQPRFNMALFSAFAFVGLALAAAGIYGVISYHVTRRTSEIGIRVALGAKSGDVVRLVMAMGARLVVFGLLIGLLVSAGLARLVKSQVFDASALDAISVLGVAAVLCGAALTACYIPARRAARVDPMIALRHE